MSIIKTRWSGAQELDHADKQAWLIPNEALLADSAKKSNARGYCSEYSEYQRRELKPHSDP